MQYREKQNPMVVRERDLYCLGAIASITRFAAHIAKR